MATDPTAKRSLDERLKDYPEIREQLERMVEELEHEAGQGGSLDEVEDRVVGLVRTLGWQLLNGHARRAAALAPVPQGVKVRRHTKKKSAG